MYEKNLFTVHLRFDEQFHCVNLFSDLIIVSPYTQKNDLNQFYPEWFTDFIVLTD